MSSLAATSDLWWKSAVTLHEVGQDQRRFIEAFGRDVLPALDRSAR